MTGKSAATDESPREKAVSARWITSNERQETKEQRRVVGAEDRRVEALRHGRKSINLIAIQLNRI